MVDFGCGLGRMFQEWNNNSKFKNIDAFEPDKDYYQFSKNYSINSFNGKINVYNYGFLDTDKIKLNYYDFVMVLHGPLQYLNKLDDRINAINNIFNSLVPGGIALVDVSNYISALPHIIENHQQSMEINGNKVLRSCTVKTDTFNCHWSIKDIFEIYSSNNNDSNSTVFTEEFKFAIISKSELELLFRNSGFINIKVCSDWDYNLILNGGNNGTKHGGRIIIIGQKPL